MQVFRATDQDATLVGWGVRVMLLAQEDSEGAQVVAKRIAGFGGLIEAESEVFASLSAMIDDPLGYGLFVMDCDAFGGLEAGMKAFSMLRAVRSRVPVILISRECDEQIFPEDRSAPIILRSPLSAVSLRVGFEHALRERLLMRAA
ncbi:MAG: hypothetical protein WCC57_09205 [Paracoccaceae bacterium]